MRDMSVASFGSGVRDAVHRLATGCVGNGVERAGYNFHYCIKIKIDQDHRPESHGVRGLSRLNDVIPFV
jgi:hypothetical protein